MAEITVQFNKTAIDVDGGRDAYRVDDEGTDFVDPDGIEGGILTIHGVLQVQHDDPAKYVSPTSAVKDHSIPESANDPNRYYDPEVDAYIVLNPPLRLAGLRLNDAVRVENLDNNTVIDAIIADVGPMGPAYEPGTLEMSPEAFRQLGIGMVFSVPQRNNKHNGNQPYQNPKYRGSNDANLKVTK